MIITKELYIVTVFKGEETSTFIAKPGDRIMLPGKRFITVGSTNIEDSGLSGIVRIDRVTSNNKYKIKQIKKNMKNNNKK